MTSRGTPFFWALYRGLPAEVKRAAQRSHQRFRQNPAHPSLHLERLRREPRLWSVRITRDYRAVARRYESDDWVWIWIGSHHEFDLQLPV